MYHSSHAPRPRMRPRASSIGATDSDMSEESGPRDARHLLGDDEWRYILKLCDAVALLRLEACCTLFRQLTHEDGQWELDLLAPDTFLVGQKPKQTISQRDACLCALVSRGDHKLRQMVQALAAVPESERQPGGHERTLALCSRVAPAVTVNVATDEDLCWIVEMDSTLPGSRPVSYVFHGGLHHDGDRTHAINDSLFDPDDPNMTDAPFPSFEDSQLQDTGCKTRVWAVHIPSKRVALVHHGSLEHFDGEDEEWWAHGEVGLHMIPEPLPDPLESHNLFVTGKGFGTSARRMQPCYFNLQLFCESAFPRARNVPGSPNTEAVLRALSLQLVWARPRGLVPRDDPDPTDAALRAAYGALARLPPEE